MAKKHLTPRVLEVRITKITPRTVNYTLRINGQSEHWRVPHNSTFDTSMLVVDQLYRVQTKVITHLNWSYKAQQHVWEETYDWVSADPITPKSKPQVRTARETAISHALAATKPGFDDGLFGGL